MEEVAEEFKCNICGDSFPTKGGLLVHHRWKHNPEQGAKMLAGAKKGAIVRTGRPRKKRVGFTCTVCQASFSSESGLRYHTKTQHNGEGYSSPKGTIKCPHCPYVSSQSGVNLHMSLAHGIRGKWGLIKENYGPQERKHDCPYCDFASTLKSGLKRHINQTHSGIKDGIFRIGDKPTRELTLSRIITPEPKQTTTMTDKILAIVAEKIYARLMEEMK